MLNLPQHTLANIKRVLLRQKKNVEKQIKEIDQEDPMMVEIAAEASESGTDSWTADVHARATTLKNDLVDLSKRITSSLLRLKKGTYGKCENCDLPIEPARLEAMPTATLCLNCSKKAPKRHR